MVACRGIMLPQYKQVTETKYRYNDKYGGMCLETETVNVEIEPICADCKQVTCKDEDDDRFR